MSLVHRSELFQKQPPPCLNTPRSRAGDVRVGHSPEEMKNEQKVDLKEMGKDDNQFNLMGKPLVSPHLM